MSYQVIARKWRPQTFEEVTGQEAITRTLRNAVEHERLHHAYLFSGARGVGKTTTARLLAKALNCHKTSKPNAQPCAADDPNVCVSCKEIAESRSIDVLEIDAASHTGVDDIRETILESINFNPARDRYKVFIIDEVHQLSKSAFNALLKTLEEPPARVEFIMATTELHKVPDTILSRCQEFEFRTIALEKIFARLKIIAEAEKINVSDEALREIARTGEGSMRDAQSNFDQVISFSGENITIQDVTVALGIAGAEILTRTAQAISNHNSADALNIVDDLIGRGQDLRNFCRDLMAFFRDLLIYKIAGDAENLLDTAILSREELKENSSPFSESDLIRFFNLLGETETKLHEATQPRYILEIGLLKLIEMRRVVSVEKLLERLGKLESLLSRTNIQSKTPIPVKSSETLNSLPEKKILKIDFPPEEVPFPTSASEIREENSEINLPESIEQIEFSQEIREPEDFNLAFQTAIPTEDFSISPTDAAEPAETQSHLRKMIAEMPIKLLPISSEELEHIEDNYLDGEYERKLIQNGEKLALIKNAAKIAAILIGDQSVDGSQTNFNLLSNNSGTAFAPAKSKPSFVIPEMELEEISSEIPILPENPTEEDLRHYAENHPLIKKTMRVFRAKIIEISKI